MLPPQAQVLRALNGSLPLTQDPQVAHSEGHLSGRWKGPGTGLPNVAALQNLLEAFEKPVSQGGPDAEKQLQTLAGSKGSHAQCYWHAGAGGFCDAGAVLCTGVVSSILASTH